MRLTVDGLSFDYGGGDVLSDVHLEVGPGEVLGILGPNGSGKTTLLRCINRVLTPKQGSVCIDGSDISAMTRQEITRLVGLVPQNSVSDFSSPTVYEAVLMGRRPHIKWGYGREDESIAWAAMRDMDVSPLASRRLDQLSGGQAQRVLMARAIAQRVGMLLLDEPTSNLDVRYQLEVMAVVREQVASRGLGACAVMHDLDLAMRFCDKALLLKNGQVIAAGPKAEVLTPELISLAYGVDAVIADVGGRQRVLIL